MTEILCIGSVLWDMIGRSEGKMRQGSDQAGRIVRRPGGVALNIAMVLKRFGLSPVLLTAVGQDRSGDELLQACKKLGLDCDHVHRMSDLPTDRYMAIEDREGLIAAVADAHTLEAAGDEILQPIRGGRLASAQTSYKGLVALDGNLTSTLLREIAFGELFEQADLRIAPASPGKALRLAPFVENRRGTLYVNLEEAGLLCNRCFPTALEAARTLCEQGAKRALVTNGSDMAADGSTEGLFHAMPPAVSITQVTGAGDTFMAAHIAAEASGASRQDSLSRALSAAAAHVSGERIE